VVSVTNPFTDVLDRAVRTSTDGWVRVAGARRRVAASRPHQAPAAPDGSAGQRSERCPVPARAPAELPADRLVPRPAEGRVFRAERPVRFGQVERSGRLRLDALAAYIQDVAADDFADSGLPEVGAWVVRRSVMVVRQAPVFGERLDLTAWSSGLGARWAERRLSVRGDRGGAVETVSLGVFVDPATFRPAPLQRGFERVYGAAAAGRQVTSRLQHASRPVGSGSGCEERPWPLRATDFDAFGHMNNTAAWAMVEELLAGDGLRGPNAGTGVTGPFRAEVEYRAPIAPGTSVTLRVQPDGVARWGLSAWAVGDDGELFVSARVVA
jgi:acyl-ACP thioesterase